MTERFKGANLFHGQPARRRQSFIEVTRPRHDREALPAPFRTVSQIYIPIELAALRKALCYERQIPVDDLVGHVNKHHERPGEVDWSGEMHLRGIGRVDEHRALVLQSGLGQLLCSLIQNGGASLDARVATGVQVLDERDATSQGAAADVQQPVGGRQPARGEKLELKTTLRLPALGIPDERRSPSRGAHVKSQPQPAPRPARTRARPREHGLFPGYAHRTPTAFAAAIGAVSQNRLHP